MKSVILAPISSLTDLGCMLAATFPPGFSDEEMVAVSPPPPPPPPPVLHSRVGSAVVRPGNRESLAHVEGATVEYSAPAELGKTKSNGGGSLPSQWHVIG